MMIGKYNVEHALIYQIEKDIHPYTMAIKAEICCSVISREFHVQPNGGFKWTI